MHFAGRGRYSHLESESEVALKEFCMTNRPPIMHAPVRGPDMTAPGYPKSISREAEQVVIQAAREWATADRRGLATDILRSVDRLKEALRVLDIVEGKS